jgi:hypothetical protein
MKLARWHNFAAFLQDVIESHSPLQLARLAQGLFENVALERIEVGGIDAIVHRLALRLLQVLMAHAQHLDEIECIGPRFDFARRHALTRAEFVQARRSVGAGDAMGKAVDACRIGAGTLTRRRA